MEGIVTRISSLLGLRVPTANGPVRPMPQGTKEIPSRKHPNKYMKYEEAVKKVNELRDKGYSYTRVARELGFSKQRVGQILQTQKRIADEKSKWNAGLSSRNRQVLADLGITSREVAIHAIQIGDIRPFMRANFGTRSFTDLCAWLGTSIPIGKYSRTHPKLACCPRCGIQFPIR
jgi:hypothetical protein